MSAMTTSYPFIAAYTYVVEVRLFLKKGFWSCAFEVPTQHTPSLKSRASPIPPPPLCPTHLLEIVLPGSDLLLPTRRWHSLIK